MIIMSVSEIKEKWLKTQVELLELSGINKAQIARDLGIKPQQLNNILNGSRGISDKFIDKFRTCYKLSQIDLFENNGTDGKLVAEKKFPLKTDHSIPLQSVPLYRITAHAGILALFHDDNSNIPVGAIQIPNLPPCDGALYVHGESMSPILKSGDIILYKKVSTDNILWGEMYLLAFTLDGDDYIAIKYIRRAADPTEVTLVSQNPDYSPQDIPLNSIRALGLVKASVRFNTMG